MTNNTNIRKIGTQKTCRHTVYLLTSRDILYNEHKHAFRPKPHYRRSPLLSLYIDIVYTNVLDFSKQTDAGRGRSAVGSRQSSSHERHCLYLIVMIPVTDVPSLQPHKCCLIRLLPTLLALRGTRPLYIRGTSLRSLAQ
jgi:hypothetical protein